MRCLDVRPGEVNPSALQNGFRRRFFRQYSVKGNRHPCEFRSLRRDQRYEFIPVILVWAPGSFARRLDLELPLGSAKAYVEFLEEIHLPQQERYVLVTGPGEHQRHGNKICDPHF